MFVKKSKKGKPRTYDVLDVSRYIINYNRRKGYSITCPRLQLLLYFIQSYCLIWTGHICFRAKIEVWGTSPVITEVDREYRRHGWSDIPVVKTYYESSDGSFWNTEKKRHTAKTSF